MHFIVLLLSLILVGCGNHPLSRTEQQKAQEIRVFFADILVPPPGPTKPAIPFKEACIRHLDALYFIINSRDILEKSGIPSEITKTIPKDLERLKNEPLEVILKALNTQEDSYFEKHQKDIEQTVLDFKFELEQLKAINIPKLGTAWTEFFQNILNNYFSNLGLEDKKRVLAYAMRNLKPDSTPTQSLLDWIYTSGPYFQKYLQLMADYLEPGDDAKLKDLQEGLKKVKDGLPHIHQYYIDTYLKELHEKGVDLIDMKSLGAATVGEAFRAKIKATGKEIVVKFMRPGIEEVAQREREFFKSQALLPALKESFNQIAEQIDEELDYRTELTKIKLGIPAYEGDSAQIHVVKPIDDFPNSQRYFAMEFVNGKTFEQLGETKLEKLAKSILWEKVARKFMQQALFAKKDAFFHGDLHGGNLMATFEPNLDLGKNPTREQVQKAIDDGLIKVVLIDFGNAHSLTQEKRQRLKNIFLSATKISNSPKSFLKAMYPENNDMGEIETLLSQTAFNQKNRENSAPKKIGEAMDILLENGLVIPGFLMAFKRTLGMLNKIYEKLDLKGSAELHHIAQDVYIDNIKDLVDEMDKDMCVSLLNGIILHAQAAEWEGEQIEELLNRPGEKEKWMHLRNAWANETDQTKKNDLFFDLINDVLPGLVKMLDKQQPAQPGQPHLDENNSPDSSVDYFIKKILSGFTIEFEAEQIAALLKDPSAKQTWTVLRLDWANEKDAIKKSEKLIKLIDFIAPITLTHGTYVIDKILSGTFLNFEAQQIADLLSNPTAKDEWIKLRKAWVNEKELSKKSEILVKLIEVIEPLLKNMNALPKLSNDDSTSSKPSDFDIIKTKIASGHFLELELKLIENVLNLPIEHELILAWKESRPILSNPDTSWYSKAYAGIKLLTSLPAALETKVLDIAYKVLPDTNYWYLRYAILPWKVVRLCAYALYRSKSANTKSMLPKIAIKSEIVEPLANMGSICK